MASRKRSKAGTSRRSPTAARALERRAQALRAEGLEQVVERTQLEGLHRVLGVGRREDDEGPVRDAREDLGPHEPGHLDVEEDEVWSQRVDGGHGLGSARCLAGHLHPVEAREHVAQPRARHRLVVGDEDGDLHTPPPEAGLLGGAVLAMRASPRL
jgi:hypothetical protein